MQTVSISLAKHLRVTPSTIACLFLIALNNQSKKTERERGDSKKYDFTLQQFVRMSKLAYFDPVLTPF